MENRISIVYEDDDLLALNKPSGILVEGVGDGEATLADWVGSRWQSNFRPLHRIDRDTTGLVLFAKNARWNRELTEMFEKKSIRKEYWVVVSGSWNSRISRVETRIRRVSDGKWENSGEGGKKAKTTFHVLGRGDSYTWLQAFPKTGRTHQLRLHCLQAGCPIVGDRFYSEDTNTPFLLHARSLAFRHPAGKGEMRLKVDPPDYWQQWLRSIPIDRP